MINISRGFFKNKKEYYKHNKNNIYKAQIKKELILMKLDFDFVLIILKYNNPVKYILEYKIKYQ